MFTLTDQLMMRRALELAELGAYTCRPNPMVGCVIARGDQIVGEGFHQRAGESHAEVHALKDAGAKARGATAYVTLEPCAHMGKTPPCADALVRAGITRVVAAAGDPFHAVAGRGFTALGAAGINVEQGLLAAEARWQNRGFFTLNTRGRPWVRIKMAMSLDGRTALAHGESKWISNEASRADVQRWRARSGALLTGLRTVIADDPGLTVRIPDLNDFVTPLRVVLDCFGKTPAKANILNDEAPTVLIHANDIVPDYDDRISGFSVPRIGEHLDLNAVLTQLGQRGVNEVQVEAGASLAGALLKANLVDELLLYIAPILLGDSGRPLFADIQVDKMAERIGFSLRECVSLGSDTRLTLTRD